MLDTEPELPLYARRMNGMDRGMDRVQIYKACWLIAIALLLNACDSERDILLPQSDGLGLNYPIGIHNARGTLASDKIITRYAPGKPLLIYLPDGPGPYPTVVFQHGRPFIMPDLSTYEPPPALVDATIEEGFALAVVIRDGHYAALGRDVEAIPCGNPTLRDFSAAGRGAANTIAEALNYLRSQSFIDSSRLVIAGTSAGGFAAINSLREEDRYVLAAITINGGRCGNRGDAIGGLNAQLTLYQRIGSEVTSPVFFLIGGRDTVIPRHSADELFLEFCRGRRDCLQRRNTFLLVNEPGTHDVSTMMDVYGQALQRIRRL